MDKAQKDPMNPSSELADLPLETLAALLSEREFKEVRALEVENYVFGDDQDLSDELHHMQACELYEQDLLELEDEEKRKEFVDKQLRAIEYLAGLHPDISNLEQAIAALSG